MKFKEVKERFLREEDGFTLVEALVTMMMMVLVMFALYSIFDMSVKVFGLGGDKVEAVENARQGLDKMEREIRAAYPYPVSEAPPKDGLFKTWEANEITFANKLMDDEKVLCPAPSSAPSSGCEFITYSVYGLSGDNVYALGRANSIGGNRQSLVEFVNYTSPSSTGLSFKYFAQDGREISPGGTEESEIVRVQIRLETKVPGDPPGTQVLTTEVDLRNRT